MARKEFPYAYEWRLLEEVTLEGEGATQALAADGMKAVIESVRPLQIQEVRLRRLRTAVKEAVHNLSRQSENGSPDLPLKIRVFVQGGENQTAEDAGINNGSEGTRSPAGGWGFFLVEKKGGNMLVNEGLEKFNGSQPPAEAACHTVELFLYPEG